MAETKTAASQVQQLPGVEQWKKQMDDQTERLQSAFDEMSKAHSKWIEYGNTQLDEMNELMKTQFNYVNELAAGMRKLTLENAKKTAETFKA